MNQTRSHLYILTIACFKLIVILLFIIPQGTYAQVYQAPEHGFSYLFPFPNATEINPETNIILKHQDCFHATATQSQIRLRDDNGVVYPGTIVLAEDGKTLLFTPHTKLPLHSIIYLQLPALPLNTGSETRAFTYTFTTKKHSNEFFFTDYKQAQSGDYPTFDPVISEGSPRQTRGIQLPVDYPTYFINNQSEAADDDYYFEGASIGDIYYQCIFDRDNIPLFYRKTEGRSVDFKINNKGYPIYFDVDAGHFVEYDSAYVPQRTYSCGNGFITDFHDILVLPSGHYFTIGLEFMLIDMSQYTSCGQTSATVRFHVIQELDESDNVIFQWRTFDHFNIMDGDSTQVDFCANNVNFCHVNSVALDDAGNILISSRHMNEVTKINRETGDIIWRFGGYNNMFNLSNDPRNGFFDQHSAHEIEEGVISIFDNSASTEHLSSRGVKYLIDTTNWTAQLLIEYETNPPILCFFAGHMQETQNGQIILGWGYNSVAASATEFNPDGSVVTNITYDTTIINNSYRSFKFPWKTTYFEAHTDTLDFGTQNVPGNIYLDSLILFNPNGHDIQITGSHINLNVFELEQNLPITLQANAATKIPISFNPIFDGYFEGKITLINQTECCGIATQVYLSGSTLESDVEEALFEVLSVYPNPFTDKIHIELQSQTQTSLEIYNVNGVLLSEVKAITEDHLTITTNHWQKGMYYLRLKSVEGTFTYKLIKI